MPEHLRALVVILALATTVFAFAKTPVCALATTAQDFNRRRNLWFAITLTAFLAHNFWIFISVTAALLLYASPREPNKLAIFFLLLFAVPLISVSITGFGVIDTLFAIHYVRLLELAVLLPAFLVLRRQQDTERFGRSIPDLLIVAYLILQFFLQLRNDTFTNSLRQGAFYAFLDVFLPYYVASRSLKSIQDFRDALMAFVTAALVLSAIGVFESIRHWLLYIPLKDALGVPRSIDEYLARDGVLRAQASAGHALALGYVIVVAIGFFLFLKKSIANATAWRLGIALLFAGLIAPMSRGPWMGAVALLLIFIASGPAALRNLMKLGLFGVALLPVLLVTPAGDKLVALLPFVGTVDAGNVLYRQRLLDISIEVIKQYPFFGLFNYRILPIMQQLIQGQGIIDIVNTYLEVALYGGLVSLALFLGCFITVAGGIINDMRKVTDKIDEHYLLGRALLSTLLAILVIIYTVSSISVIPHVYWCMAGLGVAYARLSRRAMPAGPEAQTRMAQPTAHRHGRFVSRWAK
jgi:hypothetical protein